MKNFVSLAVALLMLTLLSSGPASATPPQAPDQTVVSTTVQERKTQRTLAKRNAAAKKLKAALDKKNAANGTQAK